MTLRVGFNANYELTPRITLFGGADLIRSTFRDGRRLTPPFGSVADANETLYNLAAGASVKITDMLTGTVTYNHTDSTSDLPNRQFGRNRISVGVSAEF